MTDYTKYTDGLPKETKDIISEFSQNFEGKSQREILSMIIDEARRRRQAGTLTDKDIDDFCSVLLPLIDPSQQTRLIKLAEKLKKI